VNVKRKQISLKQIFQNVFFIFFFQQDAAKEENMRNEAQQQKEEIQAKQVSFENESRTLKNHFFYSFKNT
jgi:hypothetical protein